MKALIYLAQENEMKFKIVRAADDVNDEQRSIIARRVVEHFGGDLSGKKIALWGLAFKPETDDIREAPAKYIIDVLVEKGAVITGYDPIANPNFQAYIDSCDHLKGKVSLLKNKEDCTDEADALVLVTDWSEFKAPDFNSVGERMRNKSVFDARNIYVRSVLEKKDFLIRE